MSALSWMMYLQPVNKDRLTKERRSWNMSRIRGKDTTPEKIVRSLLHRRGYRFRLHVRIPIAPSTNPHSFPFFVRPDIVLPRYKIAVFVHGCFWHQHSKCKYCRTPKSNRRYWLPKFTRNKIRDQWSSRSLQKVGWRIVTIWECETEKLEIL